MKRVLVIALGYAEQSPKRSLHMCLGIVVKSGTTPSASSASNTFSKLAPKSRATESIDVMAHTASFVPYVTTAYAGDSVVTICSSGETLGCEPRAFGGASGHV